MHSLRIAVLVILSAAVCGVIALAFGGMLAWLACIISGANPAHEASTLFRVTVAAVFGVFGVVVGAVIAERELS